MKRYLADYGLVWVGGPPGQRHGEGEPKVEPVRTLHPRLCARGPGSAGRRVTPPRSLRCQDFSEIEFDRLVQSIRELSREAAQYARPVVRQRAGPAFPRGEETGDGRLGEVPPLTPCSPLRAVPAAAGGCGAVRPTGPAPSPRLRAPHPLRRRHQGAGRRVSVRCCIDGPRFPQAAHSHGSRPFAAESTQAFVQDVLDGYYPKEFQKDYPDGVRATHTRPLPTTTGVVRARDLPLTPIVPPPYRRR